MTNTFAYIALSGDEKLLTFSHTVATGDLTLLRALPLDGSPGPLATDPSQHNLYVGIRSSCQILTYTIDENDARLTKIGEPVSLDADPCYLATDRSGNFLFSAYFRAGMVKVHAIHEDGTIGKEPVDEWVTDERAHCILPDADNRFLFVPHIEPPNVIDQYRFNATTGKLTPANPAQIHPPAGEGPRHYAYHPILSDIVYFSNENGGSVTVYQLDGESGTLTPIQRIAGLPDDFSGENTSAQIHVHPSGHTLYMSNRGHDSLVYFTIDPDDGRLQLINWQPTIAVPRAFGLDPTGRFLYVTGQRDGDLAAYGIDETSGELNHLWTRPVGKVPSWVMLLALESA